MDDLSSKFRRRLWYIRHLKAAGLNNKDMTAMYKCFLLSVIDYASVVYGPMLSDEQTYQLEMLQASPLKIIYGFRKSYAELLQESGVERLSDRRARLIDKFVLKTANNERYKDEWFP